MAMSMRSLRSVKTIESDYGGNALDFDELLTTGCAKFNCPKKTVVQKDFQLDTFLQTMKRTQPSLKKKHQSVANALHMQTISDSVMPVDTIEDSCKKAIANMNIVDENTVVITAIYDNHSRFCEVLLCHQKVVPRVVMQILGLLTPHYPHLIKMTLRSCHIDGYTMYEMSKFLPISSITQVCLDDSPLKESNYAMLLDEPCRITSLSLCRCKISDDDCKEIASRLHHLKSAEATLTALNLSSNHITDAGAESIGEALRTNRRLRYLNLADNWISDYGADRIFRALIDFTLTYDEILEKRRRCFGYLRAKQAVYRKHLTELELKSMDDSVIIQPASGSSKKTTTVPKKVLKPKKLDGENAHNKAEMLTKEVLGEFFDPFIADYTRMVDDHISCIGNMVLCYLNLSYNNLSYHSVDKLRSTLLYQSANKKLGETGLLKVVIDGNPAPISCDMYKDICELLQNSLGVMAPSKASRKSAAIVNDPK